jgi:FKBP-type peptidyl-prolyl cis-trans isomerase FklB
MTLKWIVVLGVLLLTAQVSAVSAEEAPVFKTKKDKLSYVIGVDMGRTLNRQGIEVDLDIVTRGLKDGLSGEKLLMTEAELRTTVNTLQIEIRRKQAEMRQKEIRNTVASAEDNKKKGDAFLAENKTKEGVVTLPSGLQYKILKAGGGRKPMDDDTVEVRYRGTLIDGTEFDRSPPDGKPATFKVAGVIPGWGEALKIMPVGSKWQLFIPPHLAYAQRGAGRVIGPNATLIFDLELIAIK